MVVLGLLGALAQFLTANVVMLTPVAPENVDSLTLVVALASLVAGIALPALWGPLADRRRPTTLVGFGFGVLLYAQLLSSVNNAFALSAAFFVGATGGTLALTAAVTWLANAGRRAGSGALSSAALTGTILCALPAMSFSSLDVVSVGTTSVALIAVVTTMALQALGGDTQARAHA